MLSNEKISTDKERFIAMTQAFDYTSVILTAIRENPGLNREEIKARFTALLQWLAILPNATDKTPLQMSFLIDPLWYAFILNTKLYRAFCDKFYGKYIDHDPMDPLNADIEKLKYAKYTEKLLTDVFGDQIHAAFLDFSKIQCCYGACEDQPEK